MNTYTYKETKNRGPCQGRHVTAPFFHPSFNRSGDDPSPRTCVLICNVPRQIVESLYLDQKFRIESFHYSVMRGDLSLRWRPWMMAHPPPMMADNNVMILVFSCDKPMCIFGSLQMCEKRDLMERRIFLKGLGGKRRLYGKVKRLSQISKTGSTVSLTLSYEASWLDINIWIWPTEFPDQSDKSSELFIEIWLRSSPTDY